MKRKVLLALGVLAIAAGTVVYGQDVVETVENGTNCMKILTPGVHENLSIFIDADGNLICQEGE